MDPFDERILSVLRDAEPRGFEQMLEEVGFSHNTLRLHLDALMERGLITREKMASKGRGRPGFTYSTPRRGARPSSGALTDPGEVVTISFRGLRRLCRSQRGGRCRENRDRCEAENCPQIQKGE